MAKKKVLQTPKDDLIDSLLNDVQELSDQGAKRNKNASADLFLDDYEGSSPGKDVVVGLDGGENLINETNVGAAHLWQQVKGEPALVQSLEESHEDSTTGVSPVYEDVESQDSFEDYEAPVAPASENYPEGFKVGVSTPHDDKTVNINELAKQENVDVFSPKDSTVQLDDDSERTVAVEGFANRQPRAQKSPEPKVSLGSLRGPGLGSGSVYASGDATLVQAESLKIAQQRILELEREVEKYRQENEELASAGDIIRNRSEELTARIFALEGEKQEVHDSLQNELMLVKGSLQYKESEVGKARLKIEELEARLKSDFKKIRVRERELENRLELVKAEKSALLRAKDENILELKRKIDHLESELDNYRKKVLELNKTITTNQEQFKRTVRALRLALSNLEVKEENIVPLKKAE
ncbi:MAG: hypothetical protein IPM97_10340 [Bdellovibrionaceae bacterium]|nr:hypothetical protein [Pseudobdellovibrionaceae bacterium]